MMDGRTLAVGFSAALAAMQLGRKGSRSSAVSQVFRQMLAERYALTPSDVEAPPQICQSQDREQIQEWLDELGSKFDLYDSRW
jgi:hypothetical protein